MPKNKGKFKIEILGDRQESPAKHPTLQSIYSDGEGEKVDMTRLDRKPQHTFLKKMIIGGAIFLVLGGAAWAGFFLFNQDFQKTRGENSAAITLATENDHIASGDNLTFTVTYSNNDQAALVDTQLEVTFPKGFTFRSADPESAQDGHTWNLGRIESGSAGQIKIHGNLIGEVNSTKNLFATLTYRLSNFNYQFEKRGSLDLRIADSVVAVSIEGPSKATDLQTVSYTVKYKNTANFPVRNLRLMATYPSGFAFKKSAPTAKSENNVWDFEELGSLSEGKITIEGSLTGDESTSKEMKMTLGFMDENNDFNWQKEATLLTLIVKPEVNLSLVVNDSNKDVNVKLHDPLRYHLSYENISDLELQDVQLELDLSAGSNNPPLNDIIDWENFDKDNPGVRKDGKFLWTKDQKEELAAVQPHKKSEIVFDIRIKQNIDLKLESRKNVQVKNVFSIPSFRLEGLELDSVKIESKELAVRVNSNLKVKSEGRYFTEEFEQIGAGPLPPEVSKTTEYRIYWYVSNNFNEAGDVEVKTVLPKGVYWVGKSKTSAGESITFDAATREVKWRINKIPPHTGTLLANLEGYFMVSITPTSDQVGKLVALTDESTIQAKDTFTGDTLTDKENIITTDLENDVAAKGKGIVVKTTEKNTNTPAEAQ